MIGPSQTTVPISKLSTAQLFQEEPLFGFGLLGRLSLDTLGDVADDVSRKNATAFVSELSFYLLIFTFWDLEVVLHCLPAHSSRQDVLACRSHGLKISDRSN